MFHLLQPTPPAPLQEVSLTQDPLGATQTLDPTLLTTGDPPTPRAESTELPLLEHLRWVTPSDILCSESTPQGWPDPAHPRPDSFQPSGLIPSTPVWLTLTAILDAFGPKHTSSLSFSAKGVQHLIACRTDACQIMKWFQPTCLFQSQLSSWLTRPDDTLFFSDKGTVSTDNL